MSYRTAFALSFATVLALIVPAASGEVIDDFETNQAMLTDTGSSVVTDNGVDVILGDHRELEIELIDGTSATVEAAAGSLSFDATAGGDSQGLATLVWDADTNTGVFDGDGLGGVDLTDGNESAFRIQVESAGSGTQLILEVFTNDGNSSKAGLRLPAVAATTSFFLSYSDFVTNLGTGADFANVGAIVLRVLGTNVAADVSHFETVGPTLTVTKVDLDPADDMDYGTDPVVPGDTIRYQVQITNTGGLAQNVDLADTPDGNTSFTADSLTATPVAANDTYTAFGNVTKTVADGSGVLNNDADPDGGALFVRVSSSDSASAAGGTVTWNDAGADDQGEGGFTYLPPAGFQGVDSFTYDLEDADGNTVTAMVNVVLDRKVWFVDDDHGGANLGTFADPFTDFTQLDDSAIDVDRDGDIIFVYAHSSSNYSHAGLELEPGQQLIGEGEGLTLDGNVVVPAGASALIHANDPGAPVAHGALLTMNNTIRGVTFGDTEGAAITGTNFGTLTVSNTTVTGTGGIVDGVTGTFDVVLNSASSSGGLGHAIDLDGVGGTFDAGSTSITGGVGGVRVEDAPSGAVFDFGTAAVSGVSSGVDLGNSPMATFTFDSLDVTSTGTALNLANAGSVTLGGVTNTLETTASGAALIAATTEMTGGWTFDNITSDNSPTVGILLNSMTGGNFLVTGATDINEPMTTGIEVSTGGARTYDFGSTDISGAGSVVPLSGGRGVNAIFGNSMSSLVFDSLNVTTDNGAGVVTDGVGLLAIAGTTNSIVANNGNGLWLESTTVDEVPGGAVTGITFATLSSANSPLDGINLQFVTGSVTGNAGSITGASDAAVRIGSAANNSGGASNVTYAGSITNTQDFSVLVQERNGGAVTLSGDINDTGTGILVQNNNNGVANTITFSGSSKIVNTGTNVAVNLDNNDDATIAFTGGGLDIDTTTATGFNAVNGGTVVVSGAMNRVDSTKGSAVRILDTVIGGDGATFERVDMNGGGTATNPAIHLDDTGAGAFSVTGTGSEELGTGGTIQNLLEDAVRLFNTDGAVSLAHMIIEDIGDMSAAAPGHHGVDGQQVNGGLNLDGVTIQRVSDSAIHGEAPGGGSTTWNGLSVTNCTLAFSNRFHLGGVGDGGSTDEAMITIEGIAGTVAINSNDFDHGPGFVNLFTAAAGSIDVTIQANTMNDGRKDLNGQASVGSTGIRVNHTGTISSAIRIGDPAETNPALGNVLVDTGSDAAIIVSGFTAGDASDIDLVISQNSITVNDHLSPPGTGVNFDFPNGGIGVESRGTGTFEAIISDNTLVEPQNSGGLSTGAIRVDVSGDDTEVIVRNNTIIRAWDGPLFIRADDLDGNGARGFLLVENNVYVDGPIGDTNAGDGISDDLEALGFGGSPSPFLPNRFQVRNGAVVDLTVLNDDMVSHDTASNPGFDSLDMRINGDTVPGGSISVLNVLIQNTEAPEDFLLRNDDDGIDGTNSELNLARGLSADPAATDITDLQAESVLGDNGNTTGGGSPNANVPFGGVNIVTSTPVLPVVVAP